jgi:hypothetical protein
MAITNHFYNGTTRKYIAIFGTIFNKMSITRENNHATEIQRMVVPISYGPYQKFLARLIQDPNLDQRSAITLPRMSFEIMSMSYDGARKVGSLGKLLSVNSSEVEGARNFRWAPAPYNIEFNLYIMTKYSEDGTKILEQILPFFKPEYTTSVKLIDGLEPIDIPLVLNSIGVEDVYEGDFETRRVMMWTLSFTMKGFFFGPARNRQVIKFIDNKFYNSLEETPNEVEKVLVQPGLTANGTPTSSIEETVPYEEIDFDDDWGVIKLIREGSEDE